MKLKLLAGALGAGLLLPCAAHAQDALPHATAFVVNTLFLLMCGVLVMFMAAGFTMLEAGSVRARSVVTILIKNVALYAIAGLMFYVMGYELMFGVAEGGWIGRLATWAPDALNAAGAAAADYAPNAFWFFQMVFVATAASVVSGCLAERMRLLPFLAFVAVLAGFLYPLIGSWTWGGGWLASVGFVDFAGSTIVHSVGGWAALAGALLLGPRTGRFDRAGGARPMPHASAPQITIGVLILWFGWFGFNGGSQLSFSSVGDAITVANILSNTNAAAAGGLLAAFAFSRIVHGKPDLILTLNGALAGLVAITAEPAAPTIGVAALIGVGGGLVMIAGGKMLEAFRIDDVVGAVPVHLVAGVYGTLVAGFTHPDAELLTQLAGVLVTGATTFALSFGTWAVLKKTLGLRLSRAAEDIGSDLSELGVEAYHLDALSQI